MASSTAFPSDTGLVSVVWSNENQSDPTLARLIISNKVYWKYNKDGEQDAPISLLEFWGVNSLTLKLFGSEATSTTFNNSLVLNEGNGQCSVQVERKLHGPIRRTGLCANVKLVLTASSKDKRDSWVNELRFLILSLEIAVPGCSCCKQWYTQRKISIIVTKAEDIWNIQEETRYLLSYRCYQEWHGKGWCIGET